MNKFITFLWALIFSLILLFSYTIQEKNKEIDYISNQLEQSKVKIDGLNDEVQRVNDLYISLLHNMDNIGNVDVTVYQPVEEQTNSRYWETADQSIIDLENPKQHRWIAVSRDLHARWGGPLQFKDYVWVTGIGDYSGLYQVRDIMNRRFTDRIDILIGEDDKIFSVYDNPNVELYKMPYSSTEWFAEQNNYNPTDSYEPKKAE